MAIRYAVDTNVLVRLSHRTDPQHGLIAESIRRLELQKVELCLTYQNLGEFWNVSTRPLDKNGFGLSVHETDRRFRDLIRTMTVLEEIEEVFHTWLHVLVIHQVCGVQVHDAHIAATLEVHGIAHLLTLNTPDFKRFPNLIPIHPRDVQP